MRGLWRVFVIPVIVVTGIFFFLSWETLGTWHTWWWPNGVLWLVIGIGSAGLLRDTLRAIWQRRFALDYIALLAITTGVVTQQYLVAAIIVLMLAGGNTLEKYGMALAKRSLTALSNRIPHEVQLWVNDRPDGQVPLDDVDVGDIVFIRKGEVVPIDGTLVSTMGTFDESSLTGEPYPVEHDTHDHIRSGVVNIGEGVVIRATTQAKNSTYRKILQLVYDAQQEKSPLIRLADQYSTVFTLLTLVLAGAAYFLSHDPQRILAVLVIATPCPLILATPIALMGGMNAAAKQRIILKRLASLEVLARVNAVIFDKTGTLTMGQPIVSQITDRAESVTERDVLEIAGSLERHSLHPLAKAIVAAGHVRHLKFPSSHDVEEEIGKGISGVVRGHRYQLRKAGVRDGMAVALWKGKTKLAVIHFEEHLKRNSSGVLRRLANAGLQLLIYTGDTAERTQALTKDLEVAVQVEAECSPEKKRDGIRTLQKAGSVVAMVGDGINDAPALAVADVGIVFSNEEQTAASEAADVVLLGGNFPAVLTALHLSQETIGIAKQSILFGIGASVIGMIAAAQGLIPPLYGAFLQELIDVAVILNALRATQLRGDA